MTQENAVGPGISAPVTEAQLDDWFLRLVASNHDLTEALRQLGQAFKSVAGARIGEFQAVLEQVDRALRHAERAKSVH